jgi:alginate O-acetyltransferase complex protein AlgI
VIFTSAEFVLFFVAFFAVWACLRGQARKVWLLLGSYVFYGSWSLKFLSILLVSTLVDFQIGRVLGRTDDPRRRKLVLLCSLGLNLGLLGFFKYCNFFLESARALLVAAGLSVSDWTLSIVLPVGISFYTFQALSYTIEVYRRNLAPAEALLDYAAYVAAFPQLVAGPIERATHLLPQIQQLGSGARRADPSGWLLIALGAFKKAVIADNVAPYVDIAYADVQGSPPLALWFGTYAFAIQIYCDFSGYSDIAIGLGRLMGLDLMQNFRAPYAAVGPSDFWQRWHISLSTWLRDYLYIPLGGNRGTPAFVARNLFLTMLIGGLWHGAAWNFVLWGAYHGALLIVARLWPFARLGAALAALRGVAGIAARTLQRIAFFHLVCLGWAYFRAQSLADCTTLTRKLAGLDGLAWSEWMVRVERSGEAPYLGMVALLIALVVLAHQLLPFGASDLAGKLRRTPWALRVVFVVSLLYATAILSPEEAPPFIYFQF